MALSDRAIASLFMAPTMLLLLAMDISSQLIWTVRLSFTNFRANRPNAEVGMGIDHYAEKMLTIVGPRQALFLFWIALQGDILRWPT